jgi:hypothetical protein
MFEVGQTRTPRFSTTLQSKKPQASRLVFPPQHLLAFVLYLSASAWEASTEDLDLCSLYSRQQGDVELFGGSLFSDNKNTRPRALLDRDFGRRLLFHGTHAQFAG